MGRGRNRGLIVCLVGVGVLLIVTLLAYRLPAARDPADPAAFSAYRAQAQLKALLGDGSAHPIGSAANATVRGVILERLSQLGFDTKVQSGFVCNQTAVCGTPSNIIARLPPNLTAQTHSVVLLAAHYDSVPAGPGACDDGAGVAVLLEIARILAQSPRTLHPIALLISDGEEAGLLGAHLFVRDHPLARQVSAAVNLEARGSSGPSLMFETGAANSWLMGLYREAIARPITDSVYYSAYKTLHNDTDFSVFKAAGWQGFNFAFIGDVSHYHTALDDFSNADLRSIQQQGDNALASVLALAGSGELRSLPDGDAVYFDVLARALVTWPGSASAVAATAVLALLLLEMALLCRQRRVTVRQIGWGALGAIACPLIGGISSSALLLLLLETGKLPPLRQYSWIAHPLWMTLVCAALAAVSAGLVSILFARRTGFWGSWSGTVLLLSISALLLAIYRPGMGFLSLIASGTALLAVIPCLHARAPAESGSWRASIAALAPAWVTFALMLPLVALLYSAIGSVAWPIDTLQFCLAATLLLPLLAAATARLRRGVVAIGTAASCVGITATLLLPTYSAAWPQRINFAYDVAADQHKADWVAQPDSMKLPAAIAAAAAFESHPRPLYPGSGTRGFHAEAPWTDLRAPQLLLRGVAAAAADRTRYELHLQSPRGAAEIDAAFAAAANIHEIIVTDSSGERHIPLLTGANGMTRLHVVGLARQGLDFAVDVRGDTLEAQLVDQSFDLPGGQFLQHLRTPEATSSQDGDTTLVQHSVMLNPAAGR